MLTRPGWLAAVGAASAVFTGRIFGLVELFLLGTGVAVLLALAVTRVLLTRLSLEVGRQLTPRRVHAGQPARVELAVANRSERATPVLRLHDPVSGTQGATVLLAPVDPGLTVRSAYRLPTERREPRRAELTIGYRIPAPAMTLAAKVLTVAAPDLKPPTSVRQDGDPPRFVRAASEAHLAQAAAAAAIVERDRVGTGNVAVICPTSMVEPLAAALEATGIEFGIAPRSGLDLQVTIVPVSLVKGLEVDASVVVEPAGIVDEEAQGMRALYVGLTRSTKRLTVVHARPLPDVLRR